jgi:hypothetical protein
MGREGEEKSEDKEIPEAVHEEGVFKEGEPFLQERGPEFLGGMPGRGGTSLQPPFPHFLF